MPYARDRGEGGERFAARILRAWVDHVGGPVPSLYRVTRGRRVRAPVAVATDLAESLDFLADIGLIPLRTGRSWPFIIERDDDGRVKYFEKNEETHRGEAGYVPYVPDIVDYAAISAVLTPGVVYRAYVKRYVNNGQPVEYILDDPNLGQRPAGRGQILTAREEVVDEGEGSDRWRSISLRKPNEGEVRGRNLTPGKLESLGRQVIRARPPPYVTGWAVSLVPIGEPGRAWLAMRESPNENCLVNGVRSAIAQSNAMTAERARILDEEAKSVEADGAANEDVDRIARRLKIRIVVKDIAGLVLHESRGVNGQLAYGNKRKVIEVYRSNGHCSGSEPSFPHPTRVDLYLSTPPARDETDAAREKRVNEDVARVIAERGLKRAQVVGSEVATTDGVVHRPIDLDRALHEVAARWRKRDPINNEENYRLDSRGEEVEAITGVGGAGSLRFKLWTEQHGILPLWSNSRESWRAASIEAVAWMSPEGVKGAEHYDMRAAYLACDPRGVGPAREMAERHGFPAGGRQRSAAVTSLDEVRDLVGCVLFRSIELSERTPHSVAVQLERHFGGSLWVPIPAALWLNDAGLIKSYSLDLVMYGVGRVGALKFPDDRDSAVRLVGSCSRASAQRKFFTKDAAEATHFCELYGGRSVETSGGFMVSYDQPNGKVNAHCHIRAYVLAYLACSMWDTAVKLGNRLVRTSVDAIYVTPGPPIASLGVALADNANTARWGEFRSKPAPAALVVSLRSPTTFRFSACSASPRLETLPPAVLRRDITAVIAPGGFGKTYSALRLLPEDSTRKVVVLSHNNRGVIKNRDPKENPRGYEVKTYHEFFRLDVDQKKHPWDPAAMGTSGLSTDVIIWDEFPVAGYTLLSKILPWLRVKGIVTILCGDPIGQLQDYDDATSGFAVMGLLDDLGVLVEKGDGVDWRARDCPRLQAAKAAAWCQSSDVQLEALKSVATVMTLGEVLAAWTPADVIIEPTRKACADFTTLCERERVKRFPGAPIRLRFQPEGAVRAKYRKKGGALPQVFTPDGVAIPAAIGSVVEVPHDTILCEDEPWWKLDVATTVHGIQGDTIRAPRRIFICLDRIQCDEWCRNAIYVAMSRAENASQLVVFSARSNHSRAPGGV